MMGSLSEKITLSTGYLNRTLKGREEHARQKKQQL